MYIPKLYQILNACHSENGKGKLIVHCILACQFGYTSLLFHVISLEIISINAFAAEIIVQDIIIIPQIKAANHCCSYEKIN